MLGWLRRLLPETVIVSYTDDRGRRRTKCVYKKRFDDLVQSFAAQNNIELFDACEANILTPGIGCQVEKWIVGREIQRDLFERWRDGHAIYVVIHMDQGRPVQNLVDKATFSKMRELMR